MKVRSSCKAMFLIALVTLGFSFSLGAEMVKLPTIREISVEGDRSSSEVYGVIEENVPSLRLAYKNHLDQISGFAGRIILEVTISPEGRVEDCYVEESTTGVEEFNALIRNLVGGFKFEKIDGGSSTARFPIIFSE